MLAGLLIGLLNCLLYVAILVLLGAIAVWIAAACQWPIPWNIQRIYLLICLIVFIICMASLLLGAPMPHLIGRTDSTSRFPCPAASTICPA
jgi:hypothetical protein